MHINISFLFLFVIFITACKKKEVKEPDSHVDTFSAIVNSTPFVTTSVNVLTGGSSIPGNKQIAVYAIGTNGHGIFLTMIEYDGTLKTFTNQSIEAAYSIEPWDINNSFFNINGEIKITSIDNINYSYGVVITGIFHFDTDSTFGAYNITDGKFSIYVPY